MSSPCVTLENGWRVKSEGMEAWISFFQEVHEAWKLGDATKRNLSEGGVCFLLQEFLRLGIFQ